MSFVSWWIEEREMQRIPKCLVCKYYLKNFKCSAFPKLIPEEIASGKRAHNKIVEGQKGDFVFELKETQC